MDFTLTSKIWKRAKNTGFEFWYCQGDAYQMNIYETKLCDAKMHIHEATLQTSWLEQCSNADITPYCRLISCFKAIVLRVLKGRGGGSRRKGQPAC